MNLSDLSVTSSITFAYIMAKRQLPGIYHVYKNILVQYQNYEYSQYLSKSGKVEP
jgi:hypothetical protein